MPFVLILEDDIGFKDGFDDLLQNVLNDLPENWDAVWLGGTVNKRTDYSPLMWRLIAGTGGYGILMRETMYDAAIKILEQEMYQADVSYMKLQPNFNCFRTTRNLIVHKAGYSTIQRDYKNHADLAK